MKEVMGFFLKNFVSKIDLQKFKQHIFGFDS